MYLHHLTKKKLVCAFPKLLAAGLAQLFSYYLPSVLKIGTERSLRLPIDDAIPYVSAFVVLYVFAFLQWVLQWLFLAAEGEPALGRFVTAEIIGKLLSLGFFLLMPVTMVRQADTGSGLFGSLVALLYAIDAPTRLFPSMHCFLAWIWMRAVLCSKNVTRNTKLLTVLLALGICASTLFIKQHLFVDVPAGIALAEISLLLADALSRRKKRAEA